MSDIDIRQDANHPCIAEISLPDGPSVGDGLCAVPHPNLAEASVLQKNRKRHLRPIILSAVALVLVITILAGILTNWFGFYGPATKLLLAGTKTLSAPSFTACIELQVGSYTPDPIIVQTQMDVDAREITLVGRYEGESIIRFAIYDGYLITRSGFRRYSAKDIRKELRQFFDSMEQKEDVNWEELLQALSESLYEQYGDKLNYDEIDASLLRIFRMYNNPQWLKTTAGLTVDHTGSDSVYTFQPDAYETVQDTLACFAPVFQDPADHAALSSGISQESLQSSNLSGKCTVTKGYLTGIELSATRKDRPLSAKITFEQIGTTTIDHEELSDLLFELLTEERPSIS